jgi:hypothetical protein
MDMLVLFNRWKCTPDWRQNIAMYQVSRVITGFGSGALFSTVPVYQ